MSVQADAALAQRLKAQAYGVGFDLAGLVRLGPSGTFPHFERWLERGYAGEMGYLERGAAGRRDPRAHLPEARSALVVAINYGGTQEAGPIARYARGDDYHDVMLGRLRALEQWLKGAVGNVWTRSYVDTGPFFERELARQAGLGWFGKNTNLLNPTLGSYFLLGTLFTALDLEPDAPFDSEHCGTCTRCLDACPTSAFMAPYELDATRCISYLTIELRGAIPEELRSAMGTAVFGCDICQEVCPWNVKFARTMPNDSPLRPRAALAGKDARALARALLAMTQEAFRDAFRGSAMKRAKLRGLKRNAAVVLGNIGSHADVPLLEAVLDDPEPVVREHARWARARIATRARAADQ